MKEQPNSVDPVNRTPLFSRKRILFPLVNGVIFMLMFALLGYYAGNLLQLIAIGFVGGVVIGLAIELLLGWFDGWVYRRRVLLAALLEIILSITVIGPFIYVYLNIKPDQHPICCLSDSGLGDRVEAVLIPVADGETLAGWYAPPAETPGPVVLVLHGSGGDRRGALAHARILYNAGYGVLVYDQRALGESTGKIRSVGMNDRRDITPIIDWLSTRPEVDAERVGGVGLSLGAQILVMAAPDEPRLKAIWSDGLTVNSLEDFSPAANLRDQFTAFIDKQVYWAAEQWLKDDLIPFKQLIPQIAPRHLMLVAGGSDPYEPYFTRGYIPYMGENARYWIVENAWHVGGLTVEPELYSQRMLEFFDTAFKE
jgi:dienelactone hydrolase